MKRSSLVAALCSALCLGTAGAVSAADAPATVPAASASNVASAEANAVSQNGPIPFKKDRTPVDNDLPRVAMSLTVCLLLLAGGVYVLRRRLGLRFEPGRTGHRARVLESHRLNPQSSLHVVEFAGKQHLLGQTEHNIVCLASVPADSKPSAEQT